MRQESPAIRPGRGRGGGTRAGRGWLLAGPALDVCCVLVFVAIGRASHHDGDSAGGLAAVAWPFLAGLGAGLLVTRAWRRPEAIVPAGLGAWLGAVIVGMALRVVAGQGTAPAFIVVALAFLGLFLLGWRAVLATLRRARPAG
jgi:peptidoglycan/LPS O-acetylase OafA/YrhL